jgi:phytanoyl-CoA hydroxylase
MPADAGPLTAEARALATFGSPPVEAAIAQYRRDGFARLGRVLCDEALAGLRERSDALMRGEVVHAGMFFQHDSPTGGYQDVPRGKGYVGPSLRYRKIEKLEKDPLFREVIENRLFGRIAREVIGAEIALCRAALFTKPAEGGTELPWHQDGGSFWGLSKDPSLQLWTALDDSPEDSGCLELIPKSHLAGLATPLGGVIPDDVAARSGGRAIKVSAKAGETLLLHNYLWHRSGLNATGRPRRALTVCFMDAAITCTRRRSPRQFLRMFAPATA